MDKTAIMADAQRDRESKHSMHIMTSEKQNC